MPMRVRVRVQVLIYLVLSFLPSRFHAVTAISPVALLCKRHAVGAGSGWSRPEPRGLSGGSTKRREWRARGAGAEHDVQAAGARLGAGETVSLVCRAQEETR